MRSKISVLALLFLSTLLLSFTLQKKKKIVFFGDSITQMGIETGGYIDLMNKTIQAENKTASYELIGAGIGGNKIYDLYLRMEKDVLATSPDLVVIWVGVNDVWHKASAGTGTDYDKFGIFYDAVVKKIQAKGAQVVLVTPAAIGEKHDHSNAQDGDLNAYSNWIRSYAKKNNLGIVDLRKIFHDYSLANNPLNKESGILTYDRVHLNAKGNQLVAEAMWKAVQ